MIQIQGDSGGNTNIWEVIISVIVRKSYIRTWV